MDGLFLDDTIITNVVFLENFCSVKVKVKVFNQQEYKCLKV